MPTESDLSLDQLIELERRAAEREQAGGGGGNQGPGGGGYGGGRGGGDESGDRADDTGTIVLPWWQHPFNIAVLVVTAAALAGMIGWLIGDSGAQPEHNDVDTGFLQDMREHHEQGVLMSLVYAELADTDPEVGTVARTISRGQSVEVGRMIQLLRDFGQPENRSDASTVMDWMGDEHAGHGGVELDPDDYDDAFSAMPGMATTAQLNELEATSGAAADGLFVELMIAHHEGGIEMAQYASEHAANDEVVAFADSIVRAQGNEIVELRGLVD